MGLEGSKHIVLVAFTGLFCLFLISREILWVKRCEDHMTKNKQQHAAAWAETIDTAAVILTAGIHEKKKFENFQVMLDSFRNLSVAPDLVVLFEDWGAHPSYAHALRSDLLNLTAPTKIVSRPNDTTVLYPVHFYKGHLKMLWWWTMNTAFVITGAKQICYFEDDIAVHPDFFKWVKGVRSKIPRDQYWGLFGTGSLQYTPLCVDRYEWSLLLYYYQDFCLKEQGAWDMTLFGLHQNGPLPKLRAETTVRTAMHLPYSSDNMTEKIAEVHELASAKLPLEEYRLKTPSYGREHVQEPSTLADLNFETFVEPRNRAATQTQLLKMVEYCTSVALNTKSELQVDKKLIPLHMFNETKGVAVESPTIVSFHDADLHCNQSKHICEENADCMGFVHVGNTTRFKSNVSSEIIRNTGDIHMSLFTKKCERVTARNLCIPAFKYVDG